MFPWERKFVFAKGNIIAMEVLLILLSLLWFEWDYIFYTGGVYDWRIGHQLIGKYMILFVLTWKMNLLYISY